jgi:hypothetical protein
MEFRNRATNFLGFSLTLMIYEEKEPKVGQTRPDNIADVDSWNINKGTKTWEMHKTDWNKQEKRDTNDRKLLNQIPCTIIDAESLQSSTRKVPIKVKGEVCARDFKKEGERPLLYIKSQWEESDIKKGKRESPSNFLSRVSPNKPFPASEKSWRRSKLAELE